MRDSVEKLKQMAKDRTEEKTEELDAEARQSLLTWMAVRRGKQQDEYRRKRDELREREVQPFSKTGQAQQVRHFVSRSQIVC